MAIQPKIGGSRTKVISSRRMSGTLVSYFFLSRNSQVTISSLTVAFTQIARLHAESPFNAIADCSQMRKTRNDCSTFMLEDVEKVKNHEKQSDGIKTRVSTRVGYKQSRPLIGARIGD